LFFGQLSYCYFLKEDCNMTAVNSEMTFAIHGWIPQ
jgi:hypothetical protein